MGLLNPLLLLLAAGAAIPLLLHLFQRHQGPRFVFPALRYLRRAEKESARRIRLRQLLLMLLRIAAVLVLALAAARPFTGFGGSEHTPTAVVIVLDNSMSTAVVEGERRVLDDLAARALEMLEAAGPDDRFWLLRAGLPDEPALLGDASLTAVRVRETAPSAAAADIPAALRRAVAILAAGAEGRAGEIHLLTDLQATSFAAPLPADSGAPPLVIWHPRSAAPVNHAVAAVEVGGGMPPIAGQRATVTAAVTGGGPIETREPIDVRLETDGRLIAAGTVRPGASAVLGLPARPPGLVTGSVEVDADALRADDRRYFVAHVLPPPAVELVGQQPFIAEALSVLEQAGRIRRSGAPDVAILPGAASAEGRAPGTSIVVLPPSSPTELAAANRRLAGAGIPWRYDAPISGEARFAPATDPLLRGLADTRMQQVYAPVRTSGVADDSVLVRLTDGTPWAVRGQRAVGGTYVLLGSPLTPEASTIPTSALMLPLLDRITGTWSRDIAARSDVGPAEEVALPVGATAVIRPDDERDDVAGSSTYRAGAQPGIYRIARDDAVVGAFAVNPPGSESDLRRVEEDDLADLLPGWTVHTVSDRGGWRRAVFRERLGRELWRPLLLVLLAILAVETIVAAAGRTRREPRPAEAEAV